MRISHLCLLTTLCLGISAAQAAPKVVPIVTEPLPEEDGLKVSIGERIIELRPSDPHIVVVLQNSSSKPINVFEEWNSSGAFNLILEVIKVNGKTLDKPLIIRKGMMIWMANYPSAEQIAPGDVLVREVRLQVSKHFLDPSIPETNEDINPRGPFYWAFPIPAKGVPRQITMRAVFGNNDPVSDTGMKKQTVWTGRIASPLKDYDVYWGADNN